MMSVRLLASFATIALYFVGERTARAQLAPTGSHYAARASDTGHSPVSGLGAYAAAVPLDLPAARGGMAVPVALTYGGRGVGAGGLGWDVPLSYVQRDTSVTRRRPAYTSGGAVSPREQITVSLGGRTVQMVSDGAVWVARQDAPDLELRAEAGNTWRLVDGNGQQFVFTAPSPLLGNNVWLLAAVAGVSAVNQVNLEYDIAEHAFQGSSGFVGTGVSIDLKRVYYNHHPSTPSCPKDEVLLGYGAVSTEPLALSMPGVRQLSGGTHPLVRVRTLQEITVSRRASCSSTLQAVRRYQLEYVSDSDTGLPRLSRVSMKGRDATAASLPIAAYEYGSATTTNGSSKILRYERATDVAVPADVGATPPIASTTHDGAASSPDGGETYVSWQNLVDITGDGRPDLVFKKNGQLWLSMNRPAAGGGITLTQSPTVQLSDTNYASRPLASHSSESIRYNYIWRNQDHVWRQTIDVNGDGRLDIIDAAEEAGRWVFYLNTPSGVSSMPVTWVRYSIPVANLRVLLEQHGHVIEGDYLSLARRTTGHDIEMSFCWKRNASLQYEQFPAGFGNGSCVGLNPEAVGPESTFTEWEVKDLNGDGYPDVVFDSSPVRNADPTTPIATDEFVTTREILQLGPINPLGNEIKAVLNTVGVRLDSVVLRASLVTA